jgi:hypothetical protein
MVFLRHIVMLSLISWSLILPAQNPGEQGDIIAGATSQQPPSFEWGSYDSKKACEQDRSDYLRDPSVGARMKVAACVKMREPHPRLKMSYEYCPQ